ncbi:MAG: uroporphyrinogen decarboxylase family protein [Massiliimalia sp.]|jgi:uroporphyrinogen decarboxylase
MTKRQAVLDALNHKENTTIPFQIDLTHQALENLVNYTGDPNIADTFEGYLMSVYYPGDFTELPDRPGYFRDDFGVVWNRNGADKDIGVIDSFMIPDLENNTYEFPKLDEEHLRRQYQQLMDSPRDAFKFGAIGFSMFERAWSLMGMENTLMAMIAYPEELERLLDQICEYNLKIIDIALEYDIDGFYFGDDWGQQHGLIMGPAHWRHFIKPRMARMYRKVKDAGKYVLQHSCGDCHEIFPDLIEIGLDCYQTFQPEVYDIALMKEKYGNKLTFWGGISTQRCLPYADEQGVIDEIKRVTSILRKDGGLIIAPTHSVPFDVPPQNILAMADVFLHQDKYFNEK